jgi:hypothetical protein
VISDRTNAWSGMSSCVEQDPLTGHYPRRVRILKEGLSIAPSVQVLQ